MRHGGAAHTIDARLLREEDVLLDLDVATPEALFAHVAAAAARSLRIEAADVERRLAVRHARRSTALGRGIALPHADCLGLVRPRAWFVRPREPMCFGAPDGRPVGEVLVLLVPRPATVAHGDLLRRLSATCSDPAFAARLQAADDPASLAAIWQP